MADAVFGVVDLAYNAVKEGSPIIALYPFTNSAHIYYKYPILSTIVGLIFCYYFIKIAISVGIRMFKLFALQVIAPIPIVLSMNPSQHVVLHNYFKYLTKTYADLFIRLFCVMLVYPVIITLTDEIIPDSGNLIINLILIIALLKFAKEFPKILSEILNLDIKLADKGPGGFLGGLFGAGVGLATGAMVSKNVGLKGKDFALHTLATGFKGGVSGHKGGQQGVIGFGKSVVGGVANSYVDATQIYSTGGYGNWLKAQMYAKTGQSKIYAEQREKLSDAVTNSQQHYDSIVQQQKNVGGLKKIANDLYDESSGGGIKNSFEYRSALQRQSDALKNQDVDSYNAATQDLQRMDLEYDRAVADFYNTASLDSDSAQAVTLASIKEQINKEINSVDSSFDVSTYENIDSVFNGFREHKILADEQRTLAKEELDAFKDRIEVQLAAGKLEKGNKYKSNRNARGFQQGQRQTGSGQQGQRQTGGGQQGQGQTGGGQQGQRQTGGGQQGQGQTGGGQQGQGQTGGGQQGPNN